MKLVKGFSKLDKIDKINYLVENFFSGSSHVKKVITDFWHNDENSQQLFDDFSENTLTNFYMPYGVVPNFVLNEQAFIVPMVIEESSVVAALCKAAKFWSSRGGFRAEVIDTVKVGQVHFIWNGDVNKLDKFFSYNKSEIFNHVAHLTENMKKRGGGLLNLELIDLTDKEQGYFQIKASFNTCDAMGANFINSVLEAIGSYLKTNIPTYNDFLDAEKEVDVVMCILSNYTPQSLVRAWVECPVEMLDDRSNEMSAESFASKFARAIRIAQIDTSRATTHNKGIFNGIDGLILATGNDFRAIEACGHTYACRNGKYESLTNCEIEDGIFKFEIVIPMSLGTVGGLTSLHPLAKLSLDMLGNPNAQELMMLTAATGLAQNFAAVRSLVTSGIQKGHMKMHLMNILNQLEATDIEKDIVKKDFGEKIVSFGAVREQLAIIRNTSL